MDINPWFNYFIGISIKACLFCWHFMLPVLCLSNVKVDLSLKIFFLIYDNSTENCLDLEPLWSWLESHNQPEKINLVVFQVNEDYTTQETAQKKIHAKECTTLFPTTTIWHFNEAASWGPVRCSFLRLKTQLLRSPLLCFFQVRNGGPVLCRK